MMLPPTTPTLTALLHAYSSEYLPALAPTTQDHYRRVYRVLSEHYGSLPLTELTPMLLKEWRRQLSHQYKPATVRAYLSYLSSPLRVAVEDYEWLEGNPMSKVRRPSKPAGRIRFLTDDERAALLRSCQESPNTSLYTIVLLTLATGGRKNEVRRLRWSEVDLERGLVHFLYTKNRQRRSVPLAPPALTALRQRGVMPGSPWVFPCPTGQQPMVFQTAWTTARRRAGLVDFRFHDLRHSAASYLARSGASLHEIAEILGHKNIQETMRYVHLVPSHTRGIIDRMAAQFLTDDK